MRETSLWKWLSRAAIMVPVPKDLHMRRIENLVAEGDPDVEGCLRGHCFNIELKVAGRPARATTRVLGPGDIRPKQVPWAKDRWEAGGSSYFLIQVGSAHVARRYLVPGRDAGRIVGATEGDLEAMSIVPVDADQMRVLENACSYRSPCECST